MVNLKITADKKYLKKVVDKADYARLYFETVRGEGEEAQAARSDWLTASHYLTYLGLEALEKGNEFCKELEGTLKELAQEGTTLKAQLIFLYQAVQIGRWLKYDPDDNPGVEELEKDFDAFFDRVPIEKIRERKKDFEEFLRAKSEEELLNPMYA